MTLLLQDQSYQQIEARVDCFHRTIAKARQVLKAQQLSTVEQIAALTAKELDRLYTDKRKTAATEFLLVDLQAVEDARIGKKKPQLKVLWDRYVRSEKSLRGHGFIVTNGLANSQPAHRHLVNTVHHLTERGIGLKVLTGEGAAIDTTTTSGRLVFGIFAALAEFERALISERTVAGLASARARGRVGGGRYKKTPAKVRLTMAAIGQRETKVGSLCKDLGITRQTLYRHVFPTGELRTEGKKVLAR